MKLIELIMFYNISKKQQSINLTNILKSTTKNVKKKKKKKKELKTFSYLNIL